jgi:hypothetical protein
MASETTIQGMKDSVKYWQDTYEYWTGQMGENSVGAQHAKGAVTGYTGALKMLGVELKPVESDDE